MSASRTNILYGCLISAIATACLVYFIVFYPTSAIMRDTKNLSAFVEQFAKPVFLPSSCLIIRPSVRQKQLVSHGKHFHKIL